MIKDLQGRRFGSDQLLGHYYLLFFGTSACPDVCPLTLMRMLKAHRKISRSSEGKQYVRFQTVFVTTSPDQDKPEILKSFGKVFDKDLKILTDSKSDSPGLRAMLKAFKVPVNVSQEEAAKIKAIFHKKLSFTERMANRFFPGSDMSNEDHSRVIYLMAPDNKFVAFYMLDLNENELAAQLIEDISFDIGKRFNGTGGRPFDLMN